MKVIDFHEYINLLNLLPIGVLIVDNNYTIHVWNQWLENNTDISIEKAKGHSLFEIFHDTLPSRLKIALEQVLLHGYPQIISSTLNKFVFPMPLNKKLYPDLSMMQQNAEVKPIVFQNQSMALIVIQDVSDKIHLKNTLISMAAKFEKNSLLDMLTGVYNRRFLWKYLEDELEVAYRENYNVICVLYDLDHFKKINDRWGHKVGDEVLIMFANLLKSTLRPNDYLFRYGGEEFIIIHTRIALSQAKSISERLIKKLEKTHLKNYKINMTCSGGIAYWSPGEVLISAEKLVDNADSLMYQAKKLGRKCIMIQSNSYDYKLIK